MAAVGTHLCGPGNKLQDERADKNARNEPRDTHRLLLPLAFCLSRSYVLPL